MKSTGTEIYTISAALEQAEETMHLMKEWKPKDALQKRFIDNFLCRGAKIPEIEIEVAPNAEQINNFLEKKGFSIRLKPFPPDTIGFASVLDLLVEWLYLGEKVKITTKNGDVYEGVRIKKEGVSFFEYKVKEFSFKGAILSTKSGDNIFIAIPSKSIEGLDLMDMVENISNNRQVLVGKYDGIRFPMVDLDITNDLSWLKGLSNFSNFKPVEITQAIQQIKIKINEKGARFKSGTAIAITVLAMMTPKPDMIINEPFLLWVERNGLKKPLMASFITEESWKNPGEL